VCVCVCVDKEVHSTKGGLLDPNVYKYKIFSWHIKKSRPEVGEPYHKKLRCSLNVRKGGPMFGVHQQHDVASPLEDHL
jgi:hypothetical protein